MNIVAFGTYDARRHPRVGVLIEGLRARGAVVTECNAPLDVDTAARVAALRRPWRLIPLGVRLVGAWGRLWRQARRLSVPDVVVVGYLGVVDVRLARRLWPKAIVVLDQMAFVGDIARDRGLGRRRVAGWLDSVDAAAIRRADVVLVDTAQNVRLIPEQHRGRGVVVPVGASRDWFGDAGDAEAANPGSSLRVVFYGLYTPLQGAPVIGAAIARCGSDVQFTMIGSGQESGNTRDAAGDAPDVRWLDWVDPSELRRVVAGHDVCLGIFGQGDKAQRVVPTKVYQGAAAGCAIVTSDTEPQRSTFGDDALYVRPGDPVALADVLTGLAADRERLAEMRRRARRLAEHDFRPEAVVAPLWDELTARLG